MSMTKASSSADNGKQKVRSAEVGTDILKALAELSPSTSLSRLSEHVQMPASKVHRYLQALIASGFAEQDAATNHYGLGREALRVGLAALGSIDVLKIAALPLSQLRDELNESCFIAVWGNQGATVVSIEPAVRAVTVVTQMARCCRCSLRPQAWCSLPTCLSARPWSCVIGNWLPCSSVQTTTKQYWRASANAACTMCTGC